MDEMDDMSLNEMPDDLSEAELDDFIAEGLNAMAEEIKQMEDEMSPEELQIEREKENVAQQFLLWVHEVEAVVGEAQIRALFDAVSDIYEDKWRGERGLLRHRLKKANVAVQPVPGFQEKLFCVLLRKTNTAMTAAGKAPLLEIPRGQEKKAIELLYFCSIFWMREKAKGFSL